MNFLKNLITSLKEQKPSNLLIYVAIIALVAWLLSCAIPANIPLIKAEETPAQENLEIEAQEANREFM